MESSFSRKAININAIRSESFNLKDKLKSIVNFAKSQGQSQKSHPGFDWRFYVEYYEDLSELSSYEEAYEHWIIFGQIEERFFNQEALEQYFEQKKSELPGDFDYQGYLAANVDLQEKFAANPYKKYKAIEHFLQHGRHEGREYRLQLKEVFYQPTAVPTEKNYAESSLVVPTFQLEQTDLVEQTDLNFNKPHQMDVRLIAFYLPQFHPIPENDRWWGKGFTEWTNVSKATPLFTGHYQPHFPSDLGFYDLRVSEVRDAQAELARKYSIHGFCYYYYWFAGKRLLHRPLDEMLASKKPDFPFCLCWANENWTRRWDGASQEILIAQEHSPSNDQAFAESLVPFLRDERYIRVNGKPLILIYRVDILPNPVQATEQWRNVFRKEGIGEVHLCAAFTFGFNTDPTEFGFDAGVQFPPHGVSAKVLDPAALDVPSFSGNIYDFRDVVTNSLLTPIPKDYSLYLGVMPSWDNTARKKKSANVFLYSDPDTYKLWLSGSIEKTKERYQGEERIIFINAWNEWAEGAHLEPDQKYGHQYLLATKEALCGTYSIEIILNILRHIPLRSEVLLNCLLDDLEGMIAARGQSLSVMTQLSQKLRSKVLTVLQVDQELHKANSLLFNIERPEVGTRIDASEFLTVTGWVISKKSRPIRVDLASNDRIVAENLVDIHRKDVHDAYPEYECLDCGFWLTVRGNDLHASKLQLYVVLEDGSRIPLGLIEFQIDKKVIPMPVELQKQIQWDELQKENIEANLKLIGQFPCTENYHRLLDELEYIVKNRNQALTRLNNFLKSGSVEDFF